MRNKFETIPFDQFMKEGDMLASGIGNVSIADFINTEDIELAYWVIGGLGGVLIILYWMESQGWIQVNDKMIKLGMIGVYAVVIYKLVVEGVLPMVM